MTRIKTILKYIDNNDVVVDVGCDQALLSVELAKKKIFSIASDILPDIIFRAESNIQNDLKQYISFRVGDGLDTIKEKEANVLVLAGMGTSTILNILSKSNLRFKKIITISNNHHFKLRSEMGNLNYKILCEEIIRVKGKYYNLIVFVPGNIKYSLTELILGVNHQNLKLFKEYNLMYLNKLREIINKVSGDRKKEIINEIKIISSAIY